MLTWQQLKVGKSPMKFWGFGTVYFRKQLVPFSIFLIFKIVFLFLFINTNKNMFAR